MAYSPCSHKESDTTERLHLLTYLLIVWVSSPWPIPIHEDFTESGAEKRYALDSRLGAFLG